MRTSIQHITHKSPVESEDDLLQVKETIGPMMFTQIIDYFLF